MHVSAGAMEHVRVLLEAEPAGSAFLVEVVSGGCSGFQYRFSVGAPAQDAEIHSSADGSRVAVDSLSIPLLEEAELDWERGLLRNGPVVRNRAAASACGCGTSFSL